MKCKLCNQPTYRKQELCFKHYLIKKSKEAFKIKLKEKQECLNLSL